MSFLSGLASLLGTARNDVGNVAGNVISAVQGHPSYAPAPRTIVDFPHQLPQQVQPINTQQFMQKLPIQPLRRLPQVPMGQDPKNYGYPPDITYNPNPNTNIPYSYHNLPRFNPIQPMQLRPQMMTRGSLSPLAQLLGHINTATGMTGPGMIHSEQDIPMQGQSYYQTPFR